MRPLWRTSWRFLKKLKVELPYDSAIPLLDIYLEKMKTLIRNHSAIKRKEIMPSAATWMDLEIIILSEVSQTKTNII